MYRPEDYFQQQYMKYGGQPHFVPHPFLILPPQCMNFLQQAYNYNNRPPFFPAQDQQQKQKSNAEQVIVISDDESEKSNDQENSISVKSVQLISPPRKQLKTLDLDQLEIQGRVYDCDSSQSPPPQKRIPQKPQKPQSQIQKKKQVKIKTYYRYQIEKEVHIGKQHQQLIYQPSSVNMRLISVYKKSEQKFLQLYEKLKQCCPNACDEDVALVLNMAGKNYEKAEQEIEQKGMVIQYLLETYRGQQDDDSTDSK